MSIEDCPVLVIGFKREYEIGLVLARVIQAGVTRIYISLDGPNVDDSQEVASCESTKRAVENLVQDFKGVLHVSVSETNLGSAENVIRSLDWFFSHESFGLILEDDCLPDPTIFDYVVSLSKLLVDPSIWLVSGYRPDLSELGTEDYSLVSIPLSWGWATTEKHWQQMRKYIWADPKHSLASCFLRGANSVFWGVGSRRAKNGWVDAWDIPLANAMLEHHGSALMPPINLVSNIGTGSMASNTAKPSKFFHSTTKTWDINQYPIPELGLLMSRKKHISKIIEENFIMIRSSHRVKPLISYSMDLVNPFRKGRGRLKSRVGHTFDQVISPEVLPGDQILE